MIGVQAAHMVDQALTYLLQAGIRAGFEGKLGALGGVEDDARRRRCRLDCRSRVRAVVPPMRANSVAGTLPSFNPLAFENPSDIALAVQNPNDENGIAVHTVIYAERLESGNREEAQVLKLCVA
jgi:hypothetical protein